MSIQGVGPKATLMVSANVPASVQVDGQPAGPAPALTGSLPPGLHRVVVTPRASLGSRKELEARQGYEAISLADVTYDGVPSLSQRAVRHCSKRDLQRLGRHSESAACVTAT